MQSRIGHRRKVISPFRTRDEHVPRAIVWPCRGHQVEAGWNAHNSVTFPGIQSIADETTTLRPPGIDDAAAELMSHQFGQLDSRTQLRVRPRTASCWDRHRFSGPAGCRDAPLPCRLRDMLSQASEATKRGMHAGAVYCWLPLFDFGAATLAVDAPRGDWIAAFFGGGDIANTSKASPPTV